MRAPSSTSDTGCNTTRSTRRRTAGSCGCWRSAAIGWPRSRPISNAKERYSGSWPRSPAPRRSAPSSGSAAPSCGPEVSTGGRERNLAPSSLVGRQAEWARLREAWEWAVNGRASFALVTGVAGIGKSRLAEELLTWAERQGVATAKTRSYAAEGRLSLAPVREWLRSDALLPHLAGLDDVWRAEVARILPELLSARPGLPRLAPMTELGDRLRFFEALARAMLLAPPPLLLLIDDLQWCDRETLEWLHFLSRFDPKARLLVLGTARSEELAPRTRSGAAAALRSASQLAEVALEPLDAAETAELAAQVGDRVFDVDAATRLYRETEGNPLFVVETVRAESGGESPPGVPEQGIARVSSPRPRGDRGPPGPALGPRPGDGAAAAVVGRAFDVEVLVRLVGAEDVVARALDELWRKRIVREQGPNAYDFTHDKLREVAYGETSAPKRRLLHRRVAEVLIATAPRRTSIRSAPRSPRTTRAPASSNRRSPITRKRRSSPRASTPTTKRSLSSAAACHCSSNCPRARAATAGSSSSSSFSSRATG